MLASWHDIDALRAIQRKLSLDEKRALLSAAVDQADPDLVSVALGLAPYSADLYKVGPLGHIGHGSQRTDGWSFIFYFIFNFF